MIIDLPQDTIHGIGNAFGIFNINDLPPAQNEELDIFTDSNYAEELRKGGKRSRLMVREQSYTGLCFEWVNRYSVPNMKEYAPAKKDAKPHEKPPIDLICITALLQCKVYSDKYVDKPYLSNDKIKNSFLKAMSLNDYFLIGSFKDYGNGKIMVKSHSILNARVIDRYIVDASANAPSKYQLNIPKMITDGQAMRAGDMLNYKKECTLSDFMI